MIGSCSKAFTVASMGILMDDFQNGKNPTRKPPVKTFNWKTKIQDLLPDEWMLEDSWASQKANVLDMFSHVTGLAA